MLTVKIENLHVHVTVQSAVVEPTQGDEILTQLANVRQDIKEFRQAMKLTDQELTELLDGIDKATNQTAENVQTIATVSTTIKSEMDAFIAAAPAGTVLSDAQVSQLQGFSTKLQAAADAGLAQVDTLKAIAAEGQPVVPAVPPPVA
jgi:phosphoenolpyruvate carboxylase